MNVMNAIRSAETEDQRDADVRLHEARALLPNDGMLQDFFDALFTGAVPEDILRSTPGQLAALAQAVWAQARARAGRHGCRRTGGE